MNYASTISKRLLEAIDQALLAIGCVYSDLLSILSTEGVKEHKVQPGEEVIGVIPKKFQELYLLLCSARGELTLKIKTEGPKQEDLIIDSRIKMAEAIFWGLLAEVFPQILTTRKIGIREGDKVCFIEREDILGTGIVTG